MNCEYEFHFLSDVLEKCHIHSVLVAEEDTLADIFEPYMKTIIGVGLNLDLPISKVLGRIEEKTKYKLNNEMYLRYIFIKLPFRSEKNVLAVGPYLSSPITQNKILEMCEAVGFAPDAQRFLLEYYLSLPVILENDRMHVMIDTFCERIWSSSAFSIVEINGDINLTVAPVDQLLRSDDFNEALASVESMELRYSFENELINAVVLGQQHKENLFSSVFNEKMFEKRLQDPLRNAKNYCIIMNTILRKAAEQGGVHPLYIDRASSKFAAKIELITDVRVVADFMAEMFYAYCRLVRKHSTNGYSTVVKKAILMIDSDISAELSLKSIANRLDITSVYLATVFKKETGKTVTEYVRGRRINRAVQLLNTTNLQIQTVAMHCGIMDVQYFSRIFKKEIGKTPKEYRNAVRREST